MIFIEQNIFTMIWDYYFFAKDIVVWDVHNNALIYRATFVFPILWHASIQYKAPGTARKIEHK